MTSGSSFEGRESMIMIYCHIVAFVGCGGGGGGGGGSGGWW